MELKRTLRERNNKKMKKRKTYKLLLGFLLIISPLLILYLGISNSTIKASSGAVPILESPDVTQLDLRGNIVGGNENVNFKDAIPIRYMGKSRIDDLTVTPEGQSEIKVNMASTYNVGSVFRVANSGFYKGKPMKLAFRSNKKMRMLVTSDGDGEYIKPYPTGNYDSGRNSDPIYEIWVEDSEGKEITDPKVKFVFPFQQTLSGSQTDAAYSLSQLFGSKSGVGNLFVQKDGNSNPLNPQYIGVDLTSNAFDLVMTGRPVNAKYNYLYNPSEIGHLFYGLSIYTGTYPDGTKITNGINNTAAFLQSGTNMLIPLSNGVPNALDSTNDDTNNFSAKIDFTQSLYKQSDDSFYPDSLKITLDVSKMGIQQSVDNIKVSDSDGNNITQKIGDIVNQPNGTLEMTLSKALLQELGDNVLTYSSEYQIDRTNPDLIQYYDTTTGYFSFPFTAKNSDSTDTTTGIAKVKMPAPTADPIPQTVRIGSSTEDLKAADLVTNLSSLVPNDTVEVVGFKETKTFSTEGSESAVVQIKSKETGLVGEITIPITVVKILEEAQLSWTTDKLTDVENESVDGATIAESFSKNVYWQTPLENRQYVMLTTNTDTGDIVTTQPITNGASIGTYQEEMLEIPSSAITSGINHYSVAIYATDEAGAKTGNALSTIKLTLTVSGNIVTEQANLSFQTDDIVTAKKEELASPVKEALNETFYWQTIFKNKQYQVVVKKGSEIIYQQAATNSSTGDNSWLQESVTIPADKLMIGENKLTIAMYTLDADGKLSSDPLSQIDLTVTVVDAALSWSSSSVVKQKTESLDKSTMSDVLVQKIYWQTSVANRNYLLITKDASGKTVTSQKIVNDALVSKYQEVSISVPTETLKYGNNTFSVAIYRMDSSASATGDALDSLSLIVNLSGSLQIVSIPDVIDFNVQTLNPKKLIRVDDPSVSGDLVVADTRDGINHQWVVKVSLTKPIQSAGDTGVAVLLPTALKYKPANKDEFTVTSEAQEILSENDGYGKFNISSEWGSTKESSGFKFETSPANIAKIGAYTGEITYTISDTYEP